MLHKAMAEQNKDYIADHHKEKEEKNQAAGGAAGMSCWCPCYKYYKSAEDIGEATHTAEPVAESKKIEDRA